MKKISFLIFIFSLVGCGVKEFDVCAEGEYKPYTANRIKINVVSSEGYPVKNAKASLVSPYGENKIQIIEESISGDIITGDDGSIFLTNVGKSYGYGLSQKCIVVKNNEYCKNSPEVPRLGEERLIISAENHHEIIGRYKSYIECQAVGSICRAINDNEGNLFLEIEMTVTLQHK